MNKALKYFLMLVWLLFASIGFMVLWVSTPILGFLHLSESTWIFLMKTFNATCCESSADMVENVGLFFGFIFASILLALFLFIKNRNKEGR